MSHATYELSTDGAAPVELYTFTVPGTSLVWRYCTDTVPLTVASLVYLPEAITRSAVTRTMNEPSSDITIDVGDENPFALALFSGLTARPVEVVIRQFHRGDPDAQLVNVFTGFAAGVAFDDAKASITCVPRLSVASRRRVPWQTYQATCNWQLFSPGCTLDRAAWVRGPYSLGSAAFSGPTMTISGAHADGDLSNGYVERVADGDRRFIEQNVGGVLTLQAAFPGVTSTAESWNVYPGCRRTEADCAARYDNLVHFLGWPRLPALNPFGRSAFYLSGAAEAASPADQTWDFDGAGGGYTVNTTTQDFTLNPPWMQFDNDAVVPTDVTYGVSILADGYARVSTTSASGTSTATLGLSAFISPKASGVGAVIPQVLRDTFEILIESEPLTANPGYVSGSSVLAGPFDTWVPLTDTGLGYGVSMVVPVGPVHPADFHVKVRAVSDGVIRAEGHWTVHHSADQAVIS